MEQETKSRWFLKEENPQGIIPDEVLKAHDQPSPETLRLFEQMQKSMDEYKQDVKEGFREIKDLLKVHIEKEDDLHSNHENRIRSIEISQGTERGRQLVETRVNGFISSIVGAVIVAIVVSFIK